MLIVGLALSASMILYLILSYLLIVRAPDVKRAQSKFLIPLTICMFVPICAALVLQPKAVLFVLGVTWLAFQIHFLWRSLHRH